MASTPKPNPQIVKDEILEYLRREGLAVFHVEPEMWPTERTVWWDSDREPDYRKFVTAAKAAGAQMLLYFDQELTEETLGEVEDSLELATLEPEEFREYARELGDMRSYIGFTSRMGIGFAKDGIFYWYELESPWYEQLMDLMEELQMSSLPYDSRRGEPDEDEENPPLGNFYSNN